MNLRKNMMLLVGGGLAVVLSGVAIFFLLKFRGEYVRVVGELKSSMTQLDRLHKRDPFPSKDNVAQTRQNVELLQEFQSELIEKLSEGQAMPATMESAEFKQLLETTLSGLRSKAGEIVALPPRFAFGFDVYQGGAFPKPGDIGRLVTQLRIVEQLCEILYAAEIESLDMIERDKFDQRVEVEEMEVMPDSRSRRGRGSRNTSTQEAPLAKKVDKGKGLYEKEMLTITLKTFESSLWPLVDRLSRDKPFVVITGIQFKNEAKGVLNTASLEKSRLGAAGQKAGFGSMAGANPFAMPPPSLMSPSDVGLTPFTADDANKSLPPLSHDERVVAGRERVIVKLSLEVYRFLQAETAEENP